MTQAALPGRDEIPGAGEFQALRRAAGMSARGDEAVARGLPRSLFAHTIRSGERLVAMIRIVGDGGCNFEIVDVVVDPEFQRRGLGKRLMARAMAWLEGEAPPSAYVSLIADDHSPALYRRFGFREVAPASIGMALRIGADGRPEPAAPIDGDA